MLFASLVKAKTSGSERAPGKRRSSSLLSCSLRCSHATAHALLIRYQLSHAAEQLSVSRVGVLTTVQFYAQLRL